MKLVAVDGTQSVSLPAGRALLAGRLPSCDLAVRDLTVSRRHAEIEEEGDGVRVRDLGSTNGTFIDGRRVRDGLVPLGARVAFGKVVFEVQEESAPAHPPPREDDSLVDATILRQVEVRPAGNLSARLTPEGYGPSRLRIGGQSASERQALKLGLLLDIARELSQHSDLDRLLDKVVGLILQVMAVGRAALLTVDSTGALIPRVQKTRPSVGGSISGSWSVPKGIARKAMAERIAVLLETGPGDGKLTTDGHPGAVENALCAPLIGGQGTVLGIIYLDNHGVGGVFSEEDLEFLSAFSGLVGVAIENGQLIRRAQREAVVRSNFQRYFTPELAAQIANQHGEVRLGGVRRRVVVLFSDIRGFTALSEELAPDQIAIILSDYFTEMVEIVFTNGGTLDKFMGDAMMALWGAPIGHPDDADRALAAAIAMQQRLEALNAKWRDRGRKHLAIGIGINVGEVFAGNVGSEQRLDYTVIGDAVNVASHLCSQAGAGEILVAESLLRGLRQLPAAEAVPDLTFKGRAQPVSVVRLDWRGQSPARQAL